MQTSRITIRDVKSSDESTLFEMYSDPLVMQYSDDNVFTSIELVRETIKSIKKNHCSGIAFEYVIALKDNDKAIGVCSLSPKGNGVFEVGYMLNRFFWKKGIMRESLFEFLRIMSKKLNVVKYFADINLNNIRSINTVKSLGFVYDKCANGYVVVPEQIQHNYKCKD